MELDDYETLSEISDILWNSMREQTINYDGECGVNYLGKLQNVIGFTICEKSIADKIIRSQSEGKRELLRLTAGDFGTGAYVYEGNYPFLEFESGKPSGKLAKTTYQHPVVLGMVIQLGSCLDLLEADNHELP